MKLYEVPKGTYVQLLEKPTIPPVATELKENEIIFFDHIDGMYSYCINSDGHVVHPAAYTDVLIVHNPKNPISLL